MTRAPVTNTAETPRDVPAEELQNLYHKPLEEFTGARNELAKSLRSAGKAEAADWVKALKKPSRAAWLVNQLSVRKSDEIGELLEAGRELRAAQEEMLAGSPDRDQLREAARREQRTVDSLLRTAEAIGREHGVGEQILTRVGETLQAAVSDPEAAEAIEAGRLTREQRAASIGLVGPATPAAPKGKTARAKEKEEKERRDRRQRAKHRKEAERKLGTAKKRLERERAKLERAREAVEEAEERVHSAELDANAARRVLEEI
jgi:hypothetical protein